MDRSAFSAAAKQLGLALTDRQLDSFQSFEDRLYESNAVMNLTRVPREECWLRHFLDSLLLHDLIPQGSRVLDLGTGPGFPAWPLACARPDLQVVALDSSGKMLGFLQRNLLPNLKAVLDRAETWGEREKFDVVTGRAVAPLGIQLELSAAPCRVGGAVVPMRTPAEEEAVRSFSFAVLGLSLESLEVRPLPNTEITRLFPVLRKTGKTDRHYPRPWAEIKRAPVG